jgi:DHA1 family tetracycline resistance protein-like MFS transporter
MVYPLLTSFLYHLSIALVSSTLPNLLNTILQRQTAGNSQTALPKTININGVSKEASVLYSDLLAVDQLLTLLACGPALTLSDRYGRKPLLIWSTLGAFVGWGSILLAAHDSNIMGFDASTQLKMLYVGRAVDGVSSIMAPLACAYTCDITPDPLKYGPRVGLLQGLSIGLAFLLGAPLGGFLVSNKGGKRDPAFPILIATAVSGLNLLFATFIVPESKILSTASSDKKTSLSRSIIKSLNPAPGIFMILNNAQLRNAILTLSLVYVGVNSWQVTIFNVAKLKFGMPPSQTSLMQGASGIFLALVPSIVLPRLGNRRTYRLGATWLSVALLCAGLAEQQSSFVFAGLMVALGGALTLPSLTGEIQALTPQSQRGAVLGAVEQLITFNKAVTYPTFGRILRRGIEEGMVGRPYLVGGAAVGAGSLVANFLA